MSLLRFAARSLFAGQFIVDGVAAVAHPDDRAVEAERVSSTVTPLVQRVLPAHLASSVPDEPETWSRLLGGAQILGGVMFATGIGRRLGAGLLTGATGIRLIASLPAPGAGASAKEAARPDILRSASLFGAAVLATLDTQGRPGLKWRAEQAAKDASQKSAALSDDASAAVKSASRKVEKKLTTTANRAKREAKKLNKKLDAVTAR